MNEIGILLRTTRESSGVSLEEASTDLKIKELILSNIEEGNIGCFKDIFVLKDYIYDYAKYLGLDADKTINDFNEYLFESTSKINVAEIEKAVKAQQSEDAKEEKRIVSPYTSSTAKHRKLHFVLIYITIISLIILVVFMAIRQITINNEIARLSSYEVGGIYESTQ